MKKIKRAHSHPIDYNVMYRLATLAVREKKITAKDAKDAKDAKITAKDAKITAKDAKDAKITAKDAKITAKDAKITAKDAKNLAWTGVHTQLKDSGHRLHKATGHTDTYS